MNVAGLVYKGALYLTPLKALFPSLTTSKCWIPRGGSKK